MVVEQKTCPVPICTVSDPSGKSKSNTLESLTIELFASCKNLFNNIDKIPNNRKITHFHSPFEPLQAKGRRVSLHLLLGVNEKLKRV